MKNIFLTYAKYCKDADHAVLHLLNGLSNEDREKERGSYYKSLSGLARHLLNGTLYFQSLFKPALTDNPQAVKALEPLEGITVPQETLTQAQWTALVPVFETADNTVIALVSSLTEEDFKVPVRVPWYNGKPDAVPVSFLLQSLVIHGAHHRGQISQVLDELKIEHNFSPIKIDFLG
ncbi:MAG: DUF664 domain-containing protein [Spirochaetaceae bacterium]|jgi:uncharacterized damage-inducible protein DinB|nr:DUF664 domain-containing protein [Spirochaetaceae bacterium]